MAAPYLLLAFTTVLPEDHVRAALRRDATHIALGVLFIAIGLAAASVFKLRTRNRDKIVLWFGVFALLFGVRLLALADTVRFATGVPDHFWFYFAAGISYVIPVPALLFLREIFVSWRPVLGWLFRFQLLFAGTALVCDQVLGRPESLRSLNSALMLVAFLALIVALFRRSGSDSSVRALRVGALTFSLTVILRNLATLDVLPSRLDLEPLGFAVFLAALGRVVVIRTLEREERLMALDKELAVARQIQEAILPRCIPQLPSLSIAARYVPMTAVAGDFYDFLCIDDRRMGILVADVSGHGVPAALIASMVKIAISAQAHHADNPAQVLSGMNQTLCGKLHGQFVTAAYLFVDLEKCRIRYGAAGHPPLLWWRKSERKIESLVENGLVLGLVPQARYAFVERPITGADRFLLYTDGLIEATDGSEEVFGDERVQKILLASDGLTADQVATSLLGDLERWAGYTTGRNQEDDLTVVVVDLRHSEADEAAAEPTASRLSEIRCGVPGGVQTNHP